MAPSSLCQQPLRVQPWFPPGSGPAGHFQHRAAECTAQAGVCQGDPWGEVFKASTAEKEETGSRPGNLKPFHCPALKNNNNKKKVWTFLIHPKAKAPGSLQKSKSSLKETLESAPLQFATQAVQLIFSSSLRICLYLPQVVFQKVSGKQKESKGSW